jgi:SAM-dependent methyltransferase
MAIVDHCSRCVLRPSGANALSRFESNDAMTGEAKSLRSYVGRALEVALPKFIFVRLQRRFGRTYAPSVTAPRTKTTPKSIKLTDMAYFSSGEPATGPYVFSSTVCRTDHFLMPLYADWVRLIRQPPRLHRKQWEFVYISQVLRERGFFYSGARGIGFGVGKEPLADLYCSLGCEVLATDLAPDEAAGMGWVETNQHASSKDTLYQGLSRREDFDRRVSFRAVNMNSIPDDLRDFDFAYSSCSIEHVGSLDLSKRFLKSVLDVLRPGGLSVHTTEFNLYSDNDTVTEGPTVYWRRSDFTEVARELRAEGHFVEPLDFYPGTGLLDTYVDTPPFVESEPHLRLQLSRFACTSFGFVVRRAGGSS